LTVGVEEACRSVIRTRSADHVQARIGSAYGWILIWEKQDLVGRPDRPSAPRNGVMGQHVDYTAAPRLDIEVLGAKSPGQVSLHRAGADGSRLACELKCRKNKRPTHLVAGRWCRELLSRGRHVSDIRRCGHLRLGTRDEERSDRHESE
jgi:hypothetical protein